MIGGTRPRPARASNRPDRRHAPVQERARPMTTTAPITTTDPPRIELNGPAPDFEANTTHGPIRLSTWQKDKWIILFSHPADFTPVCTTEFIEFARNHEALASKNVAVIGNSI